MKKNPITFTTGCAISGSNYYVSSNLDELDIWESFSKTFIYKSLENTWSNLDLDGWKVISVAYQDREGIPSLIALEQDGDIGIFQQNNNQIQQIRLKKENKIYGQFNRLRVIGDFLYACGDGFQIYINKLNHWENIGAGAEELPLEITKGDLSFLDFDNDFSFKKNLYDINGFGFNDIYVCGTKNNSGFVAFYNGISWVEFDHITPSSLHGITLCPDGVNILIAGAYGTLLKGNINDGFNNLKNMGITSTFYNAEYYDGHIYIASEDGLYIYKDNKYFLVPELNGLKGVIYIEEVEDVLWVLTYKKLIKFNGSYWENIDHPDNNRLVSELLVSVQSGQLCPQSGYWFTVAKENSRQYFNQGDVFPEVQSDWGDVFWQFDGEK